MFSQGYIIDSQICILVLYILYRTMLEGRIPHRAARSYLLTMVPVALLLPMLSIPLLPAPSVTQIISSTTEQFAPVITATPVIQAVNYLLITYLCGVALMTLWILTGAIKLMLLMRKSRPERIEGLRVIFANQKITAYSVFNYIFINAALRNSAIMNELLAHEECHIRLKHSMDLVYMSTMRALLWFNPTVWHVGSMLRQVHEYQVDEDVINQGYSKARYVNLLIITETGITPELASPFSYSLTKKRLTMLSMKERCKSHKRLTLLLPIITGMIFCFSLTTKASSEQMTLITEQQPTAVEEIQQKQAEQVVEVEITSDDSANVNVSKLDTESKGRVITEIAKIVTPESEPTKTKIATTPISTDKGMKIYRISDTKGATQEKNPLVILNGQVFNNSLNNIPIDNIEHLTVLRNEAAKKIYGKAAENGVIVIATKIEKGIQDTINLNNVVVAKYGARQNTANEVPLISADVMPQFNGGDESSFRRWVQSNVAYPKEAVENGIQGRVIAQFIVDTQGKVRNVNILRGVNKSLNDAAAKTIESSPQWTPGRNKNKPVNVTFTIPIEFKLNN